MSAYQKRPAARAIILKDDHILVIKRRKNDGRQYMVTPGGGIEQGEAPEDAVIRELAEETMVTVQSPRLVFIEEPNSEIWGTQYIFLCEYASGTPQLHPDSEEQAANTAGLDWYEPMWFPCSSLPDSDYPFLSPRLGDEIVAALKNGFPDQPKQWQL